MMLKHAALLNINSTVFTCLFSENSRKIPEQLFLQLLKSLMDSMTKKLFDL